MGWRYGKSENVSIIGRRSVWGWRYAHKNRFTGPLLLSLNRPKPSPIIIESLRIFINSISVSFKNFPQKKFRYKRLHMSLRELMTERIRYSLTEEELGYNFDISFEEVANLSDEDFLELFEEIFTFQG